MRDREPEHIEAIEEDPFDSRMSETILIVYGNISSDGITGAIADSAK